MKLIRKQAEIYKSWICIFPSIEIKINEGAMRGKHFEISFHWLVFHARLVYAEVGGEA